jgi:hypothetical protein
MMGETLYDFSAPAWVKGILMAWSEQGRSVGHLWHVLLQKHEEEIELIGKILPRGKRAA